MCEVYTQFVSQHTYFIFSAHQNLAMKTWSEVSDSLHYARQDKKWLAGMLGVDEKVINHWPKRGVPAKYHQRLDELFKPAAPNVDLSADAIRLGQWLDGVPDANQRARAFIEAMAAITARIDKAEQIASRDLPDSVGKLASESHDLPAKHKTP